VNEKKQKNFTNLWPVALAASKPPARNKDFGFFRAPMTEQLEAVPSQILAERDV
jgi:hypothetical protein